MTPVILVARGKRPPLGAPEVRRVVRATLRAAGHSGSSGVTVLFTGDEEIHDLNRRFRGKDRPTDVLSFPAGAAPAGGAQQEAELGDIVISLATAAAQARKRRITIESELSILLVHGTLHLLGYDHEVDEGEMEAMERSVRGQILGSPSGRVHRRVRR